MGMVLHTIVVSDPGVVVAGGICPIRTCFLLRLKRGRLCVNVNCDIFKAV